LPGTRTTARWRKWRGEAGRGEQRPDASAQDRAMEIRVYEGSEGGRSGKRWRHRYPRWEVEAAAARFARNPRVSLGRARRDAIGRQPTRRMRPPPGPQTEKGPQASGIMCSKCLSA
jgi:hypothetical protein